MLTAVQVMLTSGDKFEFRNITEVVFENEHLVIRGKVGQDELTRAIFRKDLLKCLLQTVDAD